jgi:hypothetical protein
MKVKELLEWIDHRAAAEERHDDSITRGYLLALRHVREHIESELGEELEKEEHAKIDS